MLKKIILTTTLSLLFFTFLIPVIPLTLLPDFSFSLNNQNTNKIKLTNFSGTLLSGATSLIIEKSNPIKIRWFLNFTKLNEIELNLLFNTKDSDLNYPLKSKFSLNKQHLNILINKTYWSNALPISQLLKSSAPFPLDLDTSISMDDLEFSYSIADNKIVKKNDFKIIAFINNLQTSTQKIKNNIDLHTNEKQLHKLGDFKIIVDFSDKKSLQLVNQTQSNSTIDIGCAIDNNKCSWSGKWNLNDNWQAILAPLNIPQNTDHSTGWLNFPKI